MSRCLPSCLMFAALLSGPAFPQQSASIPPRRALITQAANNDKRVTLAGNTRSAANASNDRGRVNDSLAMEDMLLQLQRPPELQQALDKYTEELQDPSSPLYHQWLIAAQFGAMFGVAPSDVDTITRWLQSQGFTINQVYPNMMTIDFSGTAGQVRQAFNTEIHNLSVDGEAHIANMSDPQIPAALAPAIAGIVSLNDFHPHPLKKARADYTFTSQGATYQAVVPADLATIYNLNPLFAAGITGKGQTIVVIEDTNVYSTADWTTFRTKFGLNTYTSGSFTQIHPGNCRNPGVVAGNDGEAILDAEWASAAAPNAAIQLASCTDTTTTFGGLIALNNLLNASTTPPALVSISYGECEAENGASANVSYDLVYQQAVAEGISVFVSSGDEGAASCDAGANYASHGIGVNGFASTPYNVAVGGTDFADTYEGTNNTYWSATNTSVFGSAKSYIPEIPWNDSCASVLVATASGYATSAGPNGFCNSTAGLANFVTTAAGSGGPSGCAIGAAIATGVVGGSCVGYPKPSWQSNTPGNPRDGVRDIPDVSLFASNGIWGHYYVVCWSDTANGGAPCTGAPSAWYGAGGTSFSSPIMAGIQALVNQKTGSRWGNPNHTYYALASAQYSSGGTCAASGTCAFNDVTLGDIDLPCSGTIDCFDSTTTTTPGGGRGHRGQTTIIFGDLSTSSTSLAPAYGTTEGWDFATGLGTINAYNLVTYWGTVTPRN